MAIVSEEIILLLGLVNLEALREGKTEPLPFACTLKDLIICSSQFYEVPILKPTLDDVDSFHNFMPGQRFLFHLIERLLVKCMVGLPTIETQWLFVVFYQCLGLA